VAILKKTERKKEKIYWISDDSKSEEQFKYEKMKKDGTLNKPAKFD
jgi:hypothetical protein